MIVINYDIEIITPLRVSTGIGHAGYLDNTIARNHMAQPYIPGSTIKGKTRATFQRLAKGLGLPVHSAQRESTGCLLWEEKCLVCSVFGCSQSAGQLFFNNAFLPQDVQKALQYIDKDNIKHHHLPQATQSYYQHIRTNNSIDRRQSSSRQDHLFTTEHIDRGIFFEATITGDTGWKDPRLASALLVCSLRSLSQIGGGKARGTGAISIHLKEVIIDKNKETTEQLLDYLVSKVGGK